MVFTKPAIYASPEPVQPILLFRSQCLQKPATGLYSETTVIPSISS